MAHTYWFKKVSSKTAKSNIYNANGTVALFSRRGTAEELLFYRDMRKIYRSG